MRIFHICEVAVLNFSKFLQKMQKHVHRIPSSLSIRFLRFTDRRNTRKQDPFKKSRFGPFRERKFVCPKMWVEKTDFWITVRGPENPTLALGMR